MRELICRVCKMGKRGCEADNPYDVRRERIDFSDDCRHFTCPDGMRAARQALHSRSRPSVIRLDDRTVRARPFGTPHKPTDGRDRSEIIRWVVDDPESRHHHRIITKNTEGELNKSPIVIRYSPDRWESD